MSAQASSLESLIDVVRQQGTGTWLQVNQNSFMDVVPPYELRAATLLSPSDTNPQRVLGAWSGFAWDSLRGDLLIYGGGHANYAGNEVYRWNGATQLWQRASLPSEISSSSGVYQTLDGAQNAPVAAHTYDGNIYLPVADRFLTFGGGAYNSGGAYQIDNPDGSLRNTGPYFFDPGKADASKVGGLDGSGPDPSIQGGQMWNNRDLSVHASYFPEMFRQVTTGYAQQDGKDVVYVSTAPGLGTDHYLYRYTVNDVNDPLQDVWEVVGRNWNGYGGQGAGAYDPVNNVYIRSASGTTPFLYWDLDTPGPDNKDRVVSVSELLGTPDGFTMTDQFGMDYDPVRQHMVLWAVGEGVWSLDVDKASGEWVINAMAESTPFGSPTLMESGVLGKWKYIASLDAFIALETDGDVWVYKPEGWVDPLAVPEPATVFYMLAGLGMVGVWARRMHANT